MPITPLYQSLGDVDEFIGEVAPITISVESLSDFGIADFGYETVAERLDCPKSYRHSAMPEDSSDKLVQTCKIYKSYSHSLCHVAPAINI